MGSFYKTDSATPLDYMYSINAPLMEKVIKTNDQAITKNLDATDLLSKLTNYNYLAGDEEDAKKIAQGYQTQINSLADAIRKDPANWRKQLEPIRNLRQSLQQDYTSGAISKQVANYTKRKEAVDAIDKQVELYHTSGGTKGINSNSAALMKENLDSQFKKTGYDPATGKYNIYKGGQFMDDIDVQKRLSDGFDKLKADGIIKVEEGLYGPQYEYFNKVTNKSEGISKNRLLKILSERYAGDQELQTYLKERSNIGDIRGDINPYNIFKNIKPGISPEQQKQIDVSQSKIDKIKDPKIRAEKQEILKEQIEDLKNRIEIQWNEGSYLTNPMRGIIDQYAYDKTSTENDLSNNSAWNTRANIAATNERSALDRATRIAIFNKTQENLNKRFEITETRLNKAQENAEKDKQWQRDHPKGSTTSNVGLKTSTTGTTKPSAAVATVAPLPETNSVEKVATNSFENWNTKSKTTNTNVPVLSNAGLSSDIDRFENQIKENQTKLNSVNTLLASNNISELRKTQLKAEKQKLESAIVQDNSDLGQRRHFYKVSTDRALINLTQGEKDIYNSLPQDKGEEILTKELKEARKKYPTKLKEGISNNDNIFSSSYEETRPEVIAAQQKLQRYKEIKNKVDAAREEVLATLRKDHIDEDGIKLSKKDSEIVSSMILAEPTGLEHFDNAGQSTKDIRLDKKGLAWGRPDSDNESFSFADGNLSRYIENSGTTMEVISIAPSTALGNGNGVAKVRYNDPNGEIPKDKEFYIALTPKLAKQLSTKFKDDANPEIANIAYNMGNDLFNSVRNQVATANTGEKQNFTITIQTPANNSISLNTTKVDGHLFVTIPTANGKNIPLPSYSGQKGSFNGISELNRSLEKILSLQGPELNEVLKTGVLK